MLIKLTEIQKKHGKLVEIPILINPEGIAAVLKDTDEFVKGDIPIIGENHQHQVLSLIQMRTGQKLAVKDTQDEIMALANNPDRVELYATELVQEIARAIRENFCDAT